MAESFSTQDHRNKAAQSGPVPVAVVTVSDTRTEETDINARYLKDEIKRSGHQVVDYHLIKDEEQQLEDILEELIKTEAKVILFNGGTGIAPRDNTFDFLNKKLEKTLPGFGEIFRMLSYADVGAAAMLSRAVAGVYRGRVMISTPGSPSAVKLAWTKLIGPELEHLAWEVAR